MKDSHCWKFIHDNLRRGVPVVLMTVVESSAGSPGRQGFKMAVSPDAMAGTIGGGVMEFKFIQRAREMLSSEHQANPVLQRQIHDSHAPISERSGMICAGHQINALVPCRADCLAVIENIAGSHSDRRGRLRLSQRGIEILPGLRCAARCSFSQKAENDWQYEENLGPAHNMYIVGGGHVGLALSRIMATLDFYITIFDHRVDLHTMKENSSAHEKIITSYELLAEHIVESPESFVAIVSTTFKTDEAALRALLGKKLAYLGVMGSEAKIKHLLSVLREEGAREEDLARLHAPVGIPIASHSVEEIALSIAAQIVGVKNSAMHRASVSVPLS